MSDADFFARHNRQIDGLRYDSPSFTHMPNGGVMYSLVLETVQGGFTFYTVRDGAVNHHPALAGYVGREVCVYKNTERKILELRTLDEATVLCDLPDIFEI